MHLMQSFVLIIYFWLNRKYFFNSDEIFCISLQLLKKLGVMMVDLSLIHSYKTAHKIRFILIEKIRMMQRDLLLCQFLLNYSGVVAVFATTWQKLPLRGFTSSPVRSRLNSETHRSQLEMKENILLYESLLVVSLTRQQISLFNETQFFLLLKILRYIEHK